MLKDSTGMFNNPALQAEVGYPGGFGHNIKMNLTEALRRCHEPTVSPHLHIFTIRRGELLIGNNNYLQSSKNGFIEFKMPWVATSKSEFEVFCKSKKLSAVAAIC